MAFIYMMNFEEYDTLPSFQYAFQNDLPPVTITGHSRREGNKRKLKRKGSYIGLKKKRNSTL